MNRTLLILTHSSGLLACEKASFAHQYVPVCAKRGGVERGGVERRRRGEFNALSVRPLSLISKFLLLISRSLLLISRFLLKYG